MNKNNSITSTIRLIQIAFIILQITECVKCSIFCNCLSENGYFTPLIGLCGGLAEKNYIENDDPVTLPSPKPIVNDDKEQLDGRLTTFPSTYYKIDHDSEKVFQVLQMPPISLGSVEGLMHANYLPNAPLLQKTNSAILLPVAALFLPSNNRNRHIQKSKSCEKCSRVRSGEDESATIEENECGCNCYDNVMKSDDNMKRKFVGESECGDCNDDRKEKGQEREVKMKVPIEVFKNFVNKNYGYMNSPTKNLKQELKEDAINWSKTSKIESNRGDDSFEKLKERLGEISSKIDFLKNLHPEMNFIRKNESQQKINPLTHFENVKNSEVTTEISAIEQINELAKIPKSATASTTTARKIFLISGLQLQTTLNVAQTTEQSTIQTTEQTTNMSEILITDENRITQLTITAPTTEINSSDGLSNSSRTKIEINDRKTTENVFQNSEKMAVNFINTATSSTFYDLYTTPSLPISQHQTDFKNRTSASNVENYTQRNHEFGLQLNLTSNNETTRNKTAETNDPYPTDFGQMNDNFFEAQAQRPIIELISHASNMNGDIENEKFLSTRHIAEFAYDKFESSSGSRLQFEIINITIAAIIFAYIVVLVGFIMNR